MAYLVGITAGAGVPLFIRTKGDLPPPSFPMIASLNGAHMYASSLKASLLSCTSGGAVVVWKTFYDSVTLIFVASSDAPTDTHHFHLLDLIFNAMVLLVGLHELETVSNVERLKTDLRCCYPLIDYLLRGSSLMSPLTRCADVITVDDTTTLSSSLEAFTEAAESSYGCLTVNGRVCVATESWWELSTLEISLLSLFLSSLPPASCRDIPVYLPRASNKVAHRLLVFTLLEGIEVSLLCGPEPALTVVQGLVEDYWSGIMETLRGCAHVFPRCVPLGLNFEPSVLAFCLVNLDSCRCLTSLKPSTAPESLQSTLTAGFQGEMECSKRHAYLTQFYRTVVDNLLPTKRREREEEGQESSVSHTLHETVPHKIVETYVCAKRYKAYAMHRDTYNLFVLFTSTTPTFALRTSVNVMGEYFANEIVQSCGKRKMTTDVFQTLTHDKSCV